MQKLLNVFPTSLHPRLDAIALLLLRLIFGGSMVYAHGWGKLTNFDTLSTRFPDPIGVGPVVGLSFAVFAEAYCAIAVVIGLLTRLATIPLLIIMAVAVLVVHADDPFARKELGLLYFFGFLVVLARGAGPFSIDALLIRRLGSRATSEQ